MDPILQVLLSWQFVLFGLAVAMIMYVIRIVAEYIAEVLHKNLGSSKLWNELILPITPILLGLIGAILLKTFPYPGFTPDAAGHFARGDRMIFGLVAGGFSTIMYRVIKSLLYQKIVSAAQVLTGTVPQQPYCMPTEQIPPVQLPPRGQV